MDKYVLVCGSRDFYDKDKLYKVLDEILLSYPDHVILEGGAKGADRLARRYAVDNKLKYLEMTPDWSIGRHAGLERNTDMLNKNPSCVIAFSSQTFLTSGTNDTVNKAKKREIPTYIYLAD